MRLTASFKLSEVELKVLRCFAAFLYRSTIDIVKNSLFSGIVSGSISQYVNQP